MAAAPGGSRVIAELHWAAPAHAWLLLLALPAWILLRRAARERRRALALFTAEPSPVPARLSGILYAIAFALLVTALCRPQWGQVAVEQQGRGPDILVALDVSRSMLADDLAPNRLAAAKAAVAELLARLRGERIGLIAFAGSAFLVCPLTTDYATFAGVLAEAGPDAIPLGGTSLAGALAEARRAFGARKEGGGVLILISDGEDHGEAPDAATLRRAGIVVHAVAAGTPEGGLIPLAEGAFLRDGQGRIVKSRLHTAPLQSLAAGTGGRLIDLAAQPHALRALYGTGFASPRGQGPRAHRVLPVERYQVPLALALALLLVEPLLRRKT